MILSVFEDNVLNGNEDSHIAPFSTLQKMSSKVKAGKVNCDVEKNLCQNLGIDGYPTVRVYSGSRNSQQSQVTSVYIRCRVHR